MAIEIVPIQLEAEVNIDANKISFITVHPSLEEKIEDSGMGFRFVRQRESQILLIKNIFPLVKRHPSGDISYSHFLILPELSVPEEALKVIEDDMKKSEWPKNSIVMGGLEYISGEKFSKIIEHCDNPEKCKMLPSNINSLILNTAFIFIKTKNEEIKKYYQPKISSSPPEQYQQNQYRGSYLLFFRTELLAFTQIMCFDEIARPPGTSNNARDQIILKLCEKSNRDILRLDLFFILQHNDEPNHEDFRISTRELMEHGRRELIIDTVVFINTSGKKHGLSSLYGKSRFHFKKGTYADMDKDTYPVPETFSITEDRLKYAQFREDGPCVHTFIYYPPWTGGTSSGIYRLPFDRAFMHAIRNDEIIEGGRTINGLWKKMFDFLPEDLPDSDSKRRWTADRCERNSGLNLELKQNFWTIRNRLMINGATLNRLKEIVDLLFRGYDDSRRGKIKNPDFWEENYEGEGVKNLVSGLSMLQTIGDIVLEGRNIARLYTALFSFDGTECYLVFLDSHNQELTIGTLRIMYRNLLKCIGWGSIDWDKNILLLISNGGRSYTEEGIRSEVRYVDLYPEFTTGKIPDELSSQQKVKFDKFKPKDRSLYWYELDQLRGDLERNCDEIKQIWRRKLEPIRS